MNYNRLKYSRGQQVVFVVLVCFIVGCFVANWSIKRFAYHPEVGFLPDSILLDEIAQFESELDSFEWHRQGEFLLQRKVSFQRERFLFDPNVIDSLDILRLGFQPFMAHNWLQYIRKGGKIFSCQKLRTIYGIDTLLVDSICELMSFESVVKSELKDSGVVYKRKTFFACELNSADTALLCKLPGIGSGRAQMIVNYRSQVGGFYSVEQLREIENIPDSVVDNLLTCATIEIDSIKQINVNRSSIKRLHRHPYINYYQARAIYDLRWDKQHNGIISDLEELRKFFSDEEFENVKWYLSLENGEK